MNFKDELCDKNYLQHHGILGQKWGEQNGPPYPLEEGSHSKEEKSASIFKKAKDFIEKHKNDKIAKIKSSNNLETVLKNIELFSDDEVRSKEARFAIINRMKSYKDPIKQGYIDKFLDNYMNNMTNKLSNLASEKTIKTVMDIGKKKKGYKLDDDYVFYQKMVAGKVSKEEIQDHEKMANLFKKQLERTKQYTRNLLEGPEDLDAYYENKGKNVVNADSINKEMKEIRKVLDEIKDRENYS